MELIVLTALAFTVFMVVFACGFLMTFFPERFLVFYKRSIQQSRFAGWQVQHVRTHRVEYRVLGIMFMAAGLYGLSNLLFRSFNH
jgi:hypothetical protein